MTLSVSVVIATLNRQQLLRRTVKQVTQQTYAPHEIIIVDQTAESDCEAELVSMNPAVRYYRLPRPNLPSARNFGVSKACGDIVLFIDDDVEISPEFLGGHLRNYVDHKVGGVAGVVLSGSERDIKDALRSAERMFEAEMPLQNEPVPVKWLSGVNMSFRRQVLINAGMFDERFTGSAWCEDADISVRVRGLGCKLLLDPSVHVLHIGAQTGGCENRANVAQASREEERLRLFLFFILKNRRIIGARVVARNLWLAFRRHVLNRRVIRAGLRVTLRQHGAYLNSIRRALRGAPLPG